MAKLDIEGPTSGAVYGPEAGHPHTQGGWDIDLNMGELTKLDVIIWTPPRLILGDVPLALG